MIHLNNIYIMYTVRYVHSKGKTGDSCINNKDCSAIKDSRCIRNICICEYIDTYGMEKCVTGKSQG